MVLTSPQKSIATTTERRIHKAIHRTGGSAVLVSCLIAMVWVAVFALMAVTTITSQQQPGASDFDLSLPANRHTPASTTRLIIATPEVALNEWCGNTTATATAGSPQPPLPRVTFIAGHAAGVKKASLCGDQRAPLRIVLFLFGDEGDGGSSAGDGIAAVGHQIDWFTRTSTDAIAAADAGATLGPYLKEAIVTIVAASIGAKSATSAAAAAAGVVYFRDGTPIVAMQATNLSVDDNVVVEGKGRRRRGGGGEGNRAIRDAIVAAFRRSNALHGDGAATSADNSPSPPAASHHRRFVLEQLLVGGGAPHFTYALPPSALFTPLNVAGVCVLEPMLSSNAGEEREAKAYYPLDSADGGLINDNGRLPLGFVVRGRIRNESGHPAAPSSPPLTLISSCRMPLTFNAGELPPIDGRHHTKGGDVVLKGFGRFVRVSLSSLRSTTGSGAPSSLGRTGAPPPVAVYVPFFGGVRTEAVIHLMGGDWWNRDKAHGASFALPIIPLADREAIFQMKRPPLVAGCSDDPIKNPTRVVTVMPFFITEAMLRKKNALRVFLRALNATAMMTDHSDVVIVTNLRISLCMAMLRVAVEHIGQSLSYDATVAALQQAMATNKTAAGNSAAVPEKEQARIPFVTHYPNPLGTLVVIDASHPANSGHFINGLAEEAVIAAKGFYDVVRYSEEDVYITRDQFEFYCATLPWMEARNYYLNFMRFEFSTAGMEQHYLQRARERGEMLTPTGGEIVSVPTTSGLTPPPVAPPPPPSVSGRDGLYDVLTAYMPYRAILVDYRQWTRWPFFVERSRWEWDGPAEAIELVDGGRDASDVSQSPIKRARPIALEACLASVDEAFEARQRCGARGRKAPADGRLFSNDEAGGPSFGNLSAFHYGLMYRGPLLTAGDFGDDHYDDDAGGCSSVPSASSALPASHSHSHRHHREQCFILRSPRHPTFGRSSTYNAMYMVPDRRVGEWWLGGPSSPTSSLGSASPRRRMYAHRPSTPLDREDVAYFQSPLMSYAKGVVALRPYPAATQSAIGIALVGKEEAPSQPPAGRPRREYYLSRFSAIAHGSSEVFYSAPWFAWENIFTFQDE